MTPTTAPMAQVTSAPTQHALLVAKATGAGLVLVSAAEGDDARKASDELPGWMRQDRQAEVDRLVLYQQDVTAPCGRGGAGECADGGWLPRRDDPESER